MASLNSERKKLKVENHPETFHLNLSRLFFFFTLYICH